MTPLQILCSLYPKNYLETVETLKVFNLIDDSNIRQTLGNLVNYLIKKSENPNAVGDKSEENGKYKNSCLHSNQIKYISLLIKWNNTY